MSYPAFGELLRIKNDEFDEIHSLFANVITNRINKKSLDSNLTCITGRIRIAHVPYAKSLAMEKKKVVIATTSGDTKTIDKTIAQTTKGARVAHIPQVVNSNCKTY